MTSTSSISDIVNSSVQCLSHLPKDGAAVDEYVSNVEAGKVEDVKTLDARLEPLTYLFENMLTKADVATYAAVGGDYSKLSPSEYYATPSLTRYLNHIQSHPSLAPLFSYPNSPLSPIKFDLDSMPPLERKPVAAKVKKPKAPAAADAAAGRGESLIQAATESAQGIAATVSAAVAGLGEKVKELTIGNGDAAETVKEKVQQAGEKVEGAAAAVGGEKKQKEKKEKKEKKPVAAAPEPTGPIPSMVELKVGHILSVEKHPDADSLYIEQVDVGEESPRTIISGLVKYMTLEEMKGSRIVVVANMKPVKMRGVTSYAMILCATSKDGKDSGLEFVAPPEASKPGDRIYFEGPKYENEKAVDVMNPKKKIFEAIQPQLTTLDTLEACFIDKETGEVSKIRTKDGYCTVKKYAGASLS